MGCGCSGRPVSSPLFPSRALPAALARPVSGSRSLSSPACQSRSHWGVPSQHGWLSGPGREGLLQEPLSPRGWPAWWLSLAGAESRDPRSQLLPGVLPPLPHGEPVQSHVRNLARQAHTSWKAQHLRSPAFSPGPLAALGDLGGWGTLPRPPQHPTPTAPGSQSRQDRKELGLPGKAEGVRTAWTLSSPEHPAPQGALGGLRSPAPLPPSLPDAWRSLARAGCPLPF